MSENLLVDALKQNSFPILFLGAGFSSNALNRAGDPIPTGGQLSKKLHDRLGLNKNYELDVISREYIFQIGELSLYELLISQLDCCDTSEAMDIIVTQEWKRIYTTNFDNVVDFCFQKHNQKIDSYSCNSSFASDIDRHKRTLVKINGSLFKNSIKYREPIEFQNFSDEIKLTRASYLSDRFIDKSVALALQI